MVAAKREAEREGRPRLVLVKLCPLSGQRKREAMTTKKAEAEAEGERRRSGAQLTKKKAELLQTSAPARQPLSR